MTIVRAPIKGIDRYKGVDFEKGAPIVLMIIKSTVKLALPNGSYVARIRYPRGAKSGMAMFTNAEGEEVAKQDLDKPIWMVLDDPSFPDPGDHGESPSDVCGDYLVLFPRMVITGPIPGGPDHGFGFPCRDCACDAYRWRRSRPEAGGPPEGVALSTEKDAWDLGKQWGLACLKSPTSECPALP